MRRRLGRLLRAAAARLDPAPARYWHEPITEDYTRAIRRAIRDQVRREGGKRGI